MRVYLKKVDSSTWQDVTEYVNLFENILIHDTADKTFDTCKFKMILDNTFTYFPYNKSIPPKQYIKITLADVELDETEDNTYYFRTTDNSCGKLRNATEDYGDQYEHAINGVELIYDTSSYNLPEYRITQKKGINYNKYQRKVIQKYKIDKKFSQNGNEVLLPIGEVEDLTAVNASLITDIAVQYSNNRHYVRLFRVENEAYNVQFAFNYRKTAPTDYGYLESSFDSRLIEYKIYAREGNGFLTKPNSKLKVKLTARYYTDGGETEVGNPIIKNFELLYNNAVPSLERQGNTLVIPSIETPFREDRTVSITVPKRSGVEFCDIVLEIPSNNYSERNYLTYTEVDSINSQYVETRITGFTNDDYVKCEIQDLEVNVVSQLLEGIANIDLMTYADFMDKVLFDYNLNKRNKLTLSEDTRQLLDSIKAKEGEFSGYTLYEMLLRIFEYANAVPYLTIDNEIRHIPRIKVAQGLNIEETQTKEGSIDNENFYDRIITNAKNIMSDDDFITERIVIGSTSDEFDEITDVNMQVGFKTAHPIYYSTEDVFIYLPNFDFDLNGYNVKGNTGVDYLWNIGSRFLEKDIYNSLPDVRFDYERDVSENLPNGRASGQLSKANTLSYESGSNNITNIFHRGKVLPTYDFLVAIFSGTYGTDESQYALIETLICLGYEYIIQEYAIAPLDLGVPTFDSGILESSTDLVKMDVVMDAEMIITYCPIYKELTVKQMSNKEERNGVHFEKRVNTSDRVISYEDLEDVLNKEMEQKGNEIITVSEEYNSFDETIKTNSIINNDYVITTKDMAISNQSVETVYQLQEKYNIFSNDVGLSIKYERFAVPYDYVNRQVLLDNHLIFSNQQLTKYSGEPRGCESNYIAEMFIIGINKYLYGSMNISYKEEPTRFVLMKFGILKGNKTLQLVGMFRDNYSAGTQLSVYTGIPNGFSGLDPITTRISLPIRYTDIEGKFDYIYSLSIGRSIVFPVDDLTYYLQTTNNTPYDMSKFPRGTYYDDTNTLQTANINRVLVEEDDIIVNKKDAGENILINHSSYLVSENGNEIEPLSFGRIDMVGYQNNLGENIIVENIISFQITPNFNEFEFKIRVSDNIAGIDYINTNGIVFFNKEIIGSREIITPVVRIKEPNFTPAGLDEWDVIFYVYSSKYGKKGL